MVWSNQAPTEITFPPGAISGARITINSNGIFEYDSDGNLAIELAYSYPYTDVTGHTSYYPALAIGNGSTEPTIVLQSVDRAGIFYFDPNDGFNFGGEISVSNAPTAGDQAFMSIQGPGPVRGGLWGDDSGADLIFTAGSQDGTQPPLFRIEFVERNTAWDPIHIDVTDYTNNVNRIWLHTYQQGSPGANIDVMKLQIGNGLPGMYYYDRVQMSSTQVITANTSIQLTNFTLLKSYSDYPPPSSDIGYWQFLSNGTWYCVEAGIYSVVMNPRLLAVPAGFTGFYCTIQKNGFLLLESGSAAIAGSASIPCYDFAVGDTLTFLVAMLANSGTSEKLDTTNDRSCIAIRRML